MGGFICYHRCILKLHLPGNRSRLSFLNNIAPLLKNCFDYVSQMADLEEVITHHHDALELRPEKHQDCF